MVSLNQQVQEIEELVQKLVEHRAQYHECQRIQNQIQQLTCFGDYGKRCIIREFLISSPRDFFENYVYEKTPFIIQNTTFVSVFLFMISNYRIYQLRTQQRQRQRKYRCFSRILNFLDPLKLHQGQHILDFIFTREYRELYDTLQHHFRQHNFESLLLI